MELKLKYLPKFTVIGKLGGGASADGASWVLPLWTKPTRISVNLRASL